MTTQNSTVVFITGANTGLGLEVVKALCSSTRSYHILLGSRSLDNATTAIDTVKNELKDTKSTITPVQIDVESDESIQNAFKTIESTTGKLDVLINNAGESFIDVTFPF
jgi:NAD(P)-dependent dehydrogenase (short-subunit alcohol dehydrogenase family)